MTKKRRGWFKHYNDATQGTTVQKALANKEYFKVILFWHILELMNQNNAGHLSISISDLAINMRVKRDKIERELSGLRSYFDGFRIENQSEIVEIFCDNYAEYQENRGGKRVSKTSQKVRIKDKRLKIEDKRLKIKQPDNNNALNNFSLDEKKKTFEILPEFRGDELLDEILPQISPKAQRSWLRLYKDPDWIRTKLIQAIAYYQSSEGSHSVKDWGMKLNSWLARQKDIPSHWEDPFAFLNLNGDGK